MKRKPKVFTRDDALKVADLHKQLRRNSCFQSAPELWLKLKKVIRPGAYPEQSNPANDGKGYGPYPKGDVKVYGRKRVWFDKCHFNSPYAGMHERFRSELVRGNPIVVSLSPQPGTYHGYLLYAENGAGDYRLISKTSPGPGIASATIEDSLQRFLIQGQTVDCLFMSRLGDRI